MMGLDPEASSRRQDTCVLRAQGCALTARHGRLLIGVVRAHVELLRYDRPPLSRTQAGLSFLLAWWTVKDQGGGWTA